MDAYIHPTSILIYWQNIDETNFFMLPGNITSGHELALLRKAQGLRWSDEVADEATRNDKSFRTAFKLAQLLGCRFHDADYLCGGGDDMESGPLGIVEVPDDLYNSTLDIANQEHAIQVQQGLFYEWAHLEFPNRPAKWADYAISDQNDIPNTIYGSTMIVVVNVHLW